MKNPQISIIIAAGLNRQKELLRCLKSIYKSSVKDFEIIVVDNSGNQNLRQILSVRFSKVKYIKMPENKGILAINIGIANASGEYIFNLDDDCGIRKDTLKNILDYFNNASKTLGVISTNLFNPFTKEWVFRAEPNRSPKKVINFIGASIFKKSVLQKSGYFDSDFFCWQHEDDLSIRILEIGYEINFVPSIIVDHYHNQKGLRKDLAFLYLRNLAWFNIKHFSLTYIPLFVIRNIVSVFTIPWKQHSLIALIYTTVGYLSGWGTFWIPLRKRNTVSALIQKEYLELYLLNKNFL